MADLNVNSIGDASGGTTTTVNGFTPTVSNMAGRNRIINGDMRIDQRNNGASVTVPVNTVQYTVDRFYSYVVGAACTAQRVSSGRTDFPSAIQVTGATSNTYVEVGHRIESFNSADLVGGSITVSFLAARSSGTSVFVYLSYANTVDNYNGGITNIASQEVTIDSTLAQYTVTFNSLPSQTANGLQLGFLFGAVNSGQTVTITGVQLEAGSVATPFEHRQYGQELALCQRYYQDSLTHISVGAAAQGVSTTGELLAGITFQVNMRANPTITLFDQSGTSGKVSRLAPALSWNNGSTGAATDISTFGFQIKSNNGNAAAGVFARYQASAEL